MDFHFFKRSSWESRPLFWFSRIGIVAGGVAIVGSIAEIVLALLHVK